MVDVPINGRVLKWARDERHLSPADAAALLNMDEEALLALEGGDEKPTVGQLRTIASKYKISFSALLMPEPLPPNTRPEVQDFRTFEGVPPDHSLKLQRVLDEVWEQIDALVDVRDNADDLFAKSGRLPHVTLRMDPEVVAAEERRRIGISVDEQILLVNDRAAFLRWRSVVEGQGVFVRVENLGDEDNCRGFAVYDDREIPFIFLNSDESDVDMDYRARTFGLFHEYYHLLLRQSALSDHNRSNRVEALCNKFAAFFLMPRDRFELECQRLHVQEGNITEANVRKLAQTFHTSMSSVAIHLERIGIAEPGLFERLRQTWLERPKRKGQGIAQHHEKLANKFGVGYLGLVIEAAERGLLNKLDLFEMTEVKPKYIEAVNEELHARQMAHGRS